MMIVVLVSNGGGVLFVVVEQDSCGWIIVVVVGELQINVWMVLNVVVCVGGQLVLLFGWLLVDYVMFVNLLELCVVVLVLFVGVLYLSVLLVVIMQLICMQCCVMFVVVGLVVGVDMQSQVVDVFVQFYVVGYLVDFDLLQVLMWDLQVIFVIVVIYVNVYICLCVIDNLCNFSFVMMNLVMGVVVLFVVLLMLVVFGVGNGVLLMVGINFVFNNGVGVDYWFVMFDVSFVGVLCLCQLWINGMFGMFVNVDVVCVNVNLYGKLVIIVQGCSDVFVLVNYVLCVYVVQNGISEVGCSQLVFYEVINGQYFDVFLLVLGFDMCFVLVYYYNVQVLNLMWQYLKNGVLLLLLQVICMVLCGGMLGVVFVLMSVNLLLILVVLGVNVIFIGVGMIDVLF